MCWIVLGVALGYASNVPRQIEIVVETNVMLLDRAIALDKASSLAQ